jgi:hypothetical protein
MRNAELRPSFTEQAASAQLSLDTPHSADPLMRVPRTPQSIVLHIDELVLYGFAPGDRHRIAEAVERKLGRLLAEQGLSVPPAGDVDIEQVDGGSFRLSASGKAAATGSQIAGAVYGAASSVMNPSELPAAADVPSGDARL